MSSKSLAYVVWNAWEGKLPELARGWAGVRLDRAVGYWHDCKTPWETVSVQAWPSRSGEPADIFRATYTGSVCFDLPTHTLSWQLVAEWISDTEVVHRQSVDMAGLDEAARGAAVERAAADIVEWLAAALARPRPDVKDESTDSGANP